jgi:hypothetical protein
LKTRNPNLEIRNNLKTQTLKRQRLNVGSLNLFGISRFGFRALNVAQPPNRRRKKPLLFLDPESLSLVAAG